MKSHSSASQPLPRSHLQLWILRFLVAFAGLLIIGSGGLWAASLLSFAHVKPWIDGLAADGGVAFFTPDYFTSLVLRLRVVGSALLLLAVTLFVARARVVRWLTDLLQRTANSFTHLWQDLKSHMRQVLRYDDRIHWIALVGVLLLAVGLRLFFLTQPMRGDEATTYVDYIAQPFFVAISSYNRPNNHLFHTVLVYVSCALFGSSPWIVRLPAFFAGLLMVPATYQAIRMLTNKHAALLATGLVATSPTCIMFSTNARGYTLVSFFFLLLLILAIYLKQKRNLAAWVLFVLGATLGFYTIPIMLYPFGIVLLWLLLSLLTNDIAVDGWRMFKDLLLAGVAVVVLTTLLYAPALAVTGIGSLVKNEYVTAQPWGEFLGGILPRMKQTWRIWNENIPAGIAWVLGFGVLISLLTHLHPLRKTILPTDRPQTITHAPHRVHLLLPVVLWIVPLVLMQRVVPYTRVWLFLLPLYAGMAATGCVFLLQFLVKQTRISLSVISSVLTIILAVTISSNVIKTRSVFSMPPQTSDHSFAEATHLLKEQLAPDDRVYPVGKILPYYFLHEDMPLSHFQQELTTTNRLFLIVDQEYSFQEVLQEFLDSEGMETASPAITQPLNTLLEQTNPLAGSDQVEVQYIERFHRATLYKITVNNQHPSSYVREHTFPVGKSETPPIPYRSLLFTGRIFYVP